MICMIQQRGETPDGLTCSLYAMHDAAKTREWSGYSAPLFALTDFVCAPPETRNAPKGFIHTSGGSDPRFHYLDISGQLDPLLRVKRKILIFDDA